MIEKKATNNQARSALSFQQLSENPARTQVFNRFSLNIVFNSAKIDKKPSFSLGCLFGILGISTVESGWCFQSKKGSHQQGAQIDLVIDRMDKCINLCEMKYYDEEFTIDKPCLENLQKKKTVFSQQMKTRKTLFTTMITTYGVKKNAYSISVVDQQLIMDDLFD